MGMVEVTTDANGFAQLPAQPYGDQLAELHFSSTVTATAFNLLIQDAFNVGVAEANHKAWRDSAGTVKFSAVPITTLSPVVFNPQEMAPTLGAALGVKLNVNESKTLRAIFRPYA